MTILQQLAIACPLVFLGGLLDSVAGGGGLITLPAYYLTGITPHAAIASNKFSSSIGTVFSTGRFFRNGSVRLRVAALAAAFAIAGSSLGAHLALVLSDRFLRIVMLVLMPVAAVLILIQNRRQKGTDDISRFEQVPPLRAALTAAGIGLTLGAYDGFFGPGTGTFTILSFVALLGFDYKTACGNTKVVNLASNVAALVTFLFAGQVRFEIAAPAALCSVAGHWIGSGLVIRSGAKLIRSVMVVVLILLFSKIAWDFLT